MLEENKWNLIVSILCFFLGYGLVVNSLAMDGISVKRNAVIYLESFPELFWFGIAEFSLIGTYGLLQLVIILRNK